MKYSAGCSLFRIPRPKQAYAALPKLPHLSEERMAFFRNLLGIGGRALNIAVLAAAIVGSAASMASAQQPQAPVVTVAKPIARDIVEDDQFVGRFEAVDSVDIRSRVAGYLDSVHFRDGTIVNKGDLLFTIDRRPYEAAYDAAKSQVDVTTSLLAIHQDAA